MVERIWDTVTCDAEAVALLTRELGVSPIIARLLCIRGLGDLERARRFLNPTLNDLHDPFRLTDMTVAIERIRGAVARKERIAIHGDYDVDGVTSTVILRRALELLGADVIHFIPERLRDGYGLQIPALDRPACRGCPTGHLRRLRYPSGRRGTPCHGTWARPDHYGSSRA